MNTIGKYLDRQVFWLDYEDYDGQLPDKDWVCLAITNNQPEMEKFDKFIRASISRNILEFKAHGQFGEKIHDIFDETIVIMQAVENNRGINIITTWHNETLADAFWQCFFGTCLPDTADLKNIKIVCTDLYGVNRKDELKKYLKEFESGGPPSGNA